MGCEIRVTRYSDLDVQRVFRLRFSIVRLQLPSLRLTNGTAVSCIVDTGGYHLGLGVSETVKSVEKTRQCAHRFNFG